MSKDDKKVRMSTWVDPDILDGLRALSKATRAPQSVYVELGLKSVLSAVKALGGAPIFSVLEESLKVKALEDISDDTELEKDLLDELMEEGTRENFKFKTMVEEALSRRKNKRQLDLLDWKNK